MINHITHHGIYVFDQDQAVDFYVGKLGLEIVSDVDLGFMRWLTVATPGDPTREILLEKPGAPGHDDETADQVRALVSKGAMGLAVILTTDDAERTFEDFKAKSVEIIQEPVKQPYGIDFAVRDPFGNHIRITQPLAPDAAAPSDEEIREHFAAQDA